MDGESGEATDMSRPRRQTDGRIGSTPLVLVSHELCPYVQRAGIALVEKNVAFERVDIDLSDKPDWFKALSPLGKTPVLKVKQRAIFESAVILEYLEETQANPLHPDHPLERARHRSWMEFGSILLNGVARLYNAGTQAAFERERDNLRGGFDRLEAELSARRSGPRFPLSLSCATSAGPRVPPATWPLW